MMSGKDARGNNIQRLYHPAFEIDPGIASFNLKERVTLEECAKAQWLLGLPLSNKKLTRDMNAKELAIVSCPLENKQTHYDIELSIYSLIPSAGKIHSVQFFSDERMRFDTDKCDQAAELLHRFDNKKTSNKAKASWRVYCEDQGAESQLFFEVTVHSG
jgi:hypothetical protein